MAFDVSQFRDLIGRVLTAEDHVLATPAAVNLLLGTAAQESAFGTYLKQIRGPAVGAFQMEPATFRWLVSKYRDRHPSLMSVYAVPEALEWNLWLAILTARLRYRVVPKPLPAEDDLNGLAAYWKASFNTPAGKGTVDQFKESWARHIGRPPWVA